MDAYGGGSKPKAPVVGGDCQPLVVFLNYWNFCADPFDGLIPFDEYTRILYICSKALGNRGFHPKGSMVYRYQTSGFLILFRIPKQNPDPLKTQFAHFF